MNVTLNGERAGFRAGSTVADVIAELGHEPKGIAVAVNGELVPRSTWRAHHLADDDCVEVLKAAQGG